MGLFDLPIIGDIANVGLSLLGYEGERKASSKAADAQTGELRRQFDITRSDYEPFRKAGVSALPQQRRFADMFSNVLLNPNQFVKSPAFDFNLNQGINAIERSATSKGKLDSTENLQNLMTFGQGLAANEFQQFLQNLLGSANLYGGIAGTGQTATQDLSRLGTRFAENIGGTQAGGIINKANARTGLYSNLSNITNNAVDRYNWNTSFNSPWASPYDQNAYQGADWSNTLW